MLLKTLPRFPVWLPGPAGSGKTTAARNAATALGVPFHHHGAVDNVYQLLGFIDAGGTYHGTSFRAAYEHGGVFLWDEVDASNPAALVAFNAAIENGECVFPDKMVPKHPQCYFAAAANTYGTGATHEYVGRTKLDAATLDRFVMLDWHYDETLERAIAGDTPWTTYVQVVRQRCRDAGIKHLVTPRASIRGNDLLSAGIPAAAVVAMTIRKGLSDDQWSQITRTAGTYTHRAAA
jgi:MoxR-like ATPase